MADPIIEAMDRFSGPFSKLTIDAQTSLLEQYRRGWSSIQTELSALSAKVASAPTIQVLTGTGGTTTGIPPSWLFQQERYVALQGEVRGLVGGMAETLRDVTIVGQQEAWDLAAQESRAVGSALSGRPISTWASVPKPAFGAFVGAATSGPLGPLLDSFATVQAPLAGQFARDVLGAGLLTGRNPAVTARALADGLENITYGRALRISRTETLRAYREGVRQNYLNNKHIVQSWTWRAAVENADPPPCAACFGQHGSIHPLSEPMSSHPNCRCRMVPNRSPILGLEARNPKLPSAKDAFDKLPQATQRRVLGPTRLEMYRNGQVNLSDFATSRSRGPWGLNNATVRPLRELRDLSSPDRALQQISQRLFEQSAAAENEVSAVLQQLELTRPGAKLEGFGFRLKNTDRIGSKIVDDIAAGKGTMIQVGDKINDALRYTYRLGDKTYAADVRALNQSLVDSGFRMIKAPKNYWYRPGEAGYRGFHSLWETSSGARFEMQFHTAESLRIKEIAHKLYEVARLPTTSAAEKLRLTDEMEALFGTLRAPYGSRLIPRTIEGYPIRTLAGTEGRPLLLREIESVEDVLVKNEAFETGVVYDPRTGRIILDKRGEQLGVNFTDGEIELMRGNILTHNHPGAYLQRYPDGSVGSGSSFSWQDVEFMLNHGLSEMRAVSPSWRHVIRPTETWTGSFENKFTLLRIRENAETAVRLRGEALVQAARAEELRIRQVISTTSRTPGTGLSIAELRELKRAADLVESAALDAGYAHWDAIWRIVQEETGFFTYSRIPRAV